MPHVTFIHGIANKPAHDVLLRIWQDSLARDGGIDLGAEGITSSMVYWADVMYESPQAEMASHESNDSVIARGDADINMDWTDEQAESEQEWTERMTSKLNFNAAAPDGDEDYAPPEPDSDTEAPTLERIPLPWWLKRRLMKALLRDVHHYLFNTEHSPRIGVSYKVQDEIRKRTVAALKEGAEQGEPHIIVSHSMGTVIAYDCLKRVPDCPAVDGLMTIGSPLGLDEIQDLLRPEWSRENGFPPKSGGRWANVYDRLDPVAGFDPNLSNDYQQNGNAAIEDINEQNSGKWRHNISKYLGGTKLREAIAGMLDL